MLCFSIPSNPFTFFFMGRSKKERFFRNSKVCGFHPDVFANMKSTTINWTFTTITKNIFRTPSSGLKRCQNKTDELIDAANHKLVLIVFNFSASQPTWTGPANWSSCFSTPKVRSSRTPHERQQGTSEEFGRPPCVCWRGGTGAKPVPPRLHPFDTKRP